MGQRASTGCHSRTQLLKTREQMLAADRPMRRVTGVAVEYQTIGASNGQSGGGRMSASFDTTGQMHDR